MSCLSFYSFGSHKDDRILIKDNYINYIQIEHIFGVI